MNSVRLIRITAFVLVLGPATVTFGQRSYAPQPEAAKLQTKDGVALSYTYYPSSAGKDATPVVLLHDYKDTQGMFSSLASRLQQPAEGDQHESFAVVTVDLRGHGDSTRQIAPNGAVREIDAAKIGRDDIAAMSLLDMEAVRSFLVGENDNERLNLNKLCLVGVGMGATVAVNFAAKDWVAPPLLIGKQGQDVKALVLVSPRWSYRGVPINNAMRVKPLKQNAAWMLIYGKEDSKARADARRIAKQLERFHPEPEPSRSAAPRSFVERDLTTALEGSRLVSQIGTPMEDDIISFLTVQVGQKELPWLKRRNRLD